MAFSESDTIIVRNNDGIYSGSYHELLMIIGSVFHEKYSRQPLEWFLIPKKRGGRSV